MTLSTLERGPATRLLATFPALHPLLPSTRTLCWAVPASLAPSVPLPEPAHVPSPTHSPAGPDPPMAMSRLLGGFHVSVTILPVTATTCGAPSGGPGTTSESHRLEVCHVPQGPMAPQDPQASGQWAGGWGHSHRAGGKAGWLPRVSAEGSWCGGPSLTQAPVEGRRPGWGCSGLGGCLPHL